MESPETPAPAPLGAMAVPMPRKRTAVDPEPSMEAIALAELAADTKRAFERKFYGQISWTLDMSGLITIDQSASRQEALVLELMRAAFAERVRFHYLDKQHAVMRANQLEDEARHKANEPDVMKMMTKAIPDMMRQVDSAMKGEKVIDLNDEKARREFELSARGIADRLMGPPPLPEDQSQPPKVVVATLYDPLGGSTPPLSDSEESDSAGGSSDSSTEGSDNTATGPDDPPG